MASLARSSETPITFSFIVIKLYKAIMPIRVILKKNMMGDIEVLVAIPRFLNDEITVKASYSRRLGFWFVSAKSVVTVRFIMVLAMFQRYFSQRAAFVSMQSRHA